jgi:VIT1/CCC1 family predicted Fe2+/Mn2+ transporter
MEQQTPPARAHHSAFAPYFKEVIYGGIDGIITTFAVVAGFSGAALASDTTLQLSFLVVLLFGLANLFADGISMGLGNFLSVRSDQDLYRAARKKEHAQVVQNAQFERDETKAILMEKGYSEPDALALTILFSKNQDFWIDFMMQHKLEMSDPTGDNPYLTGFTTFASFLVFGAIPLLPFMIETTASANTVFVFSCIGTAVALILLGLLKWRIVGSGLAASLVEVLLVGGTAAVVAFYVGSFFGG